MQLSQRWRRAWMIQYGVAAAGLAVPLSATAQQTVPVENGSPIAQMWQNEMGANYGWPIVSLGRSYPGPWQCDDETAPRNLIQPSSVFHRVGLDLRAVVRALRSDGFGCEWHFQRETASITRMPGRAA